VPHRRQDRRRFLATVLFTDIVGSTQRAAELGDRAWRDLLEQHNALVRRELKAFEGREMDAAGDGFFAVFESPEHAVRAAASITRAVVPLGLALRAGVHIGECEVIDGKAGGMGVVIGARIAALAQGGEVLVSGSVRDLMTGSDQHFEGGEEQTLKGVAEPWRVYRLTPGGADASGPPHPRRSPMMQLYTRRHRRRLVAGTAAAVALVVAISGTYVLTRPDVPLVVGENAVGALEGDTVTAAVNVGQRPSAVAVGGGAVWVTNSAGDTVSRIDPATHAVDPIPVGSAPSGVAVGAGAVWVVNSGDSTVSRIDPQTNRVSSVRVLPGPSGVVVAAGSVWVTNTLGAAVSEIDPRSNTVTHVVRVGASPTGIAFGAGSLWITNESDGTVTRLNPVTRRQDAPIKVGSGPIGIAVADGAAWVANNLDGSLSRIDVDDLTVTSRSLARGGAGGPYGVAVSRHDVWVSSEYARTLSKVDSNAFTLLDTVPIRGSPLGLAGSGGNLWFTVAEGGSAVHRGGVLRFAATGIASFAADPATIDPATAYNPLLWRLLSMTNDGLVGFRRTGGVGGSQIVPDLATSLPVPTDNGLTYTFRLRSGVRYSNGDLVRPGDIRRGIERTLQLDQGPAGYYTVIKGADRCLGHHGTCDLSAGVVVDDRARTLTFRLTRREPDFLPLLALSSAYATPERTPLDPAKGTVVPATGPYMIKAYRPAHFDKDEVPTGAGQVELARNPHFHEWSPAAQPAGYPDRIVIDTGLRPAQAIQRVADGKADLVWEGAPSTMADALQARFPKQVHTVAGLFTIYLFLNTTVPPFDNADARHAVAYAIDRRQLAADPKGFAAGTVTCQTLPPDFPGYRPYCPYTVAGGQPGQWTGPDFPRAVRLMRRSGTIGTPVTVTSLDVPGAVRTGQRLRELLTSLGYHASLRLISKDGYFPFVSVRKNNVQAGVAGWEADFPGQASYLPPLVRCPPNPGGFNLSFFCDQRIDKQIDQALAKQTTDAAGATAIWAAIDRAVVDASPIVPFSNRARYDFVSPRVGNYQYHPQYGLLPAQIWVN
jgi:peptide/nickel transport system substrate-binding protein